jgi:hypothetical protein
MEATTSCQERAEPDEPAGGEGGPPGTATAPPGRGHLPGHTGMRAQCGRPRARWGPSESL